MKTLSLGNRSLRHRLFGLGFSTLLLLASSPVFAQSGRQVSAGHRMVLSPGAQAAGVNESAVSLASGRLVAAESRGTVTSRVSRAVLGHDPVQVVGSVLNELSRPASDRLTPNSVIRNLPSIESRLNPNAPQNETIFGSDNRTRVSTTTGMPWKWSCQLVITMSDGKQYIGTGWLAGPRCVVTAGHCVHDGGTGKTWATKVEVIPAMNGSSRPYGTFVSRSFISVNGWTKDRNFGYDYACIILPSRVGDSLGYFGFASYNDSTLKSITLNTAGYPGDKAFGTQWFTTDRVSSLSSRQIFTLMDIKKGQSGSPTWRLTNGSRFVVGIVSAETSQTNYLVRINSEVYSNLLSWRNR